MNRNKKFLLVAAVVFAVGLALITWDMARQTTFPGSKGPESEQNSASQPDTTEKPEAAH